MPAIQMNFLKSRARNCGPLSEMMRGLFRARGFDRAENGGNQNEVIDQRDSVYDRHLIWIGSNHNGISEPDQLHTLSEVGVPEISRHIDEDRNFDCYKKLGIFRYSISILLLSSAIQAQVMQMRSARAPKIVVASLASDRVVLIPWNNPRFEQAFKSDRAKEFDSILPYTVVLENQTELSIIAYSVVWTGGDGEFKGIRSVYDFSRLSQRTGLQPHSMDIVSQFRSLEAGGSQWDENDAKSARIIADRFKNEGTITITLDAVVFADGTATGPDNAHWIPRWKAWLDAEKEVFQTAVRSSPADLMANVTALSSAAIATAVNDSKGDRQAASHAAILADRSSNYADCLALARQYFARSISAELKDGTAAATVENLKNVLQSKVYPQIHRKGINSDVIH